MYSAEIGNIIREFRQLCSIPHGSGMEQAIGEHIKNRLEACGGKVSQDNSGNILGEFNASKGNENSPIIILQAHMDMVIAGDIPPEHARVNAIEDGEYIRSDGHTTLGADNGIGIATILSIVDRPPQDHGPIRAIFTVSEEVGLKGAKELSPDWLRGAAYMINTDGFHSDTEVIGGKGGLRETFSRPLITENIRESRSDSTKKKNQLNETELYEVKLEGYLGGHSGDDIDKGRCNTICQLGEMLRDVQDEFDIRIASMTGGVGYNVIPAESTAVVAIPRACKMSAAKILLSDERHMKEEFEKTDSTGRLTVNWLGDSAKGDILWEHQFQRDVLNLLADIHNGIRSRNREGEVSSSSNLGQIYEKNGVLYLGDMIRCDNKRQENKILKEHQQIAKEGKFDISVTGYHSWHSDPDGRLANVIDTIYQQNHGEPMRRKIAKVGLEPAYFHEVAPDMEIVCLGADISNAHSVKERVLISSIGTLYSLIYEAIAALSTP